MAGLSAATLLVSLAASAILFLVGFFAALDESAPADPPSVELPRHGHIQVQDRSIQIADLVKLEKLIDETSRWESPNTLTSRSLPSAQSAVERLGKARQQVIGGAKASLTSPHQERARQALDLLLQAATIQQGRLQALLPYAAGAGPARAPAPAPATRYTYGVRGTAGGRDGPGGPLQEGELEVKVAERPFGMHLQQGSTRVAEVFPGFPAHRAGIRVGCELLQIAGQKASAGTWVQVFQQAPLPFTMRLRCSRPADANPKAGMGPLSADPKNYRVMVVRKPFGMDIQVDPEPRVVEVLPGFPAEAAGVRKGFVLRAVGDKPVDGKTWFEAFQNARMPFTLTFDATVPPSARSIASPSREAAGARGPAVVDPSDDTEYENFWCEVVTVPFGMEVRALPHGLPAVESVTPRSPAAAQGLAVGDVLVQVAGRPVNSSTWFAAFQQATPPFGLRFRRSRRRAGLE